MGGGTSRQEAYRSLTGTERLASLVQSESKSSPLVFPPLALHSALRLVRRGAGGVTRRELQAVLGVEDTGVEDTNVVGIFVRGGEASLKQSFLADHEEFRRCLLALDGEESCAAWAAKMGAKVNVSVDQRCKMVVLTAASVEVPLRQSAVSQVEASRNGKERNSSTNMLRAACKEREGDAVGNRRTAARTNVQVCAS